jgi:hypothetical protein
MRIDIAVANSQHFYRLVISLLAVSVEGVMLPITPRAPPYSILTGAVDAGSSVGSGDTSGEDLNHLLSALFWATF